MRHAPERQRLRFQRNEVAAARRSGRGNNAAGCHLGAVHETLEAGDGLEAPSARTPTEESKSILDLDGAQFRKIVHDLRIMGELHHGHVLQRVTTGNTRGGGGG